MQKQKSKTIPPLQPVINNLARLFKSDIATPSNNSSRDSDILEFHKKIDPEDNKKTSPPSDEKVRIPSIWVFEVFPPAFIANFYSSVEKLGWAKIELAINHNFPTIIESMRNRSSGGGWLNLGIIARDSGRLSSIGRKAQLPEGVKFVNASIYQHLPSTTILACQFLLEDNEANSLDHTLRKHFNTFKEKVSSGHLYHTVINQKVAEVKATREHLRKLCTNWMSNYIPGLFASGIGGGTFPTCEFIALKKYSPYEQLGRIPCDSFLSMMNLDHDIDAWQSDEISGLFLQYPDRSDSKFDRLILTGNISEILTDKKLEGFAGDSREDKILCWMMFLGNTISTWVLYVIAQTYEKQLGIFRDDYSAVDVSKITQAASGVHGLDKRFLDLQKNLIPFAQELKSFCENKQLFMSDIYKFKPIRDDLHNDTEFFNSTRERLLYLSDNLSNNEQQIRTIANRTSQIVSAISNDKLTQTNAKLQKGISWMTWALVIFTLILVVLEIDDKIDLVKYFSSTLPNMLE